MPIPHHNPLGIGLHCERGGRTSRVALLQRAARYGLQTMCEGGGIANAIIIERLD
jgi:acetyl-CoA acetyltransferase